MFHPRCYLSTRAPPSLSVFQPFLRLFLCPPSPQRFERNRATHFNWMSKHNPLLLPFCHLQYQWILRQCPVRL